MGTDIHTRRTDEADQNAEHGKEARAPERWLEQGVDEEEEEAEDEAEVKLNTRVGTARVVFRFDAHGDIVAMEARERPAADPDGRPVRYDWRGRFGDYRQVGARRLPAYGEVGYVYPDGYEVYFRARVTDCRPVAGR